MESWGYCSEGKGVLFTGEMDFQVDSFARTRKSLMCWDMKQSSCFESNAFILDKDSVDGMEFMDLGFSDFPRKPLHSTTGVGVVGGGEVCFDYSKKVTFPTCIIASNSSVIEEESGSKNSDSLVESNSQDSPLIDLKLGRLADCKDALNSKILKEKSVLPSAKPYLQSKRGRTMSSCYQTPYCQVHGCNLDLSSSKDYHKRHRVCEVHSKTAKVIVNGLEQRFCQQCSRFHLLAEFDDGKRSCRKRLAGHNERRRKPQFRTLSAKPLKLVQPYQGTKLGTSFAKRAPFVFQDILHGSIIYPDRYDQVNWLSHPKLEEKLIYTPESAISIANGQVLPNSLLHLHGSGKQFTPVVSQSATGDNTVFNAASSIHELSGVSHSSCALSLLSAQSQDFPSHSAGIPIARPLLSQAGDAHHNAARIFDKPLGVSSLDKHIPNGFCLSGMYSMDVDHMGSFMVSDLDHSDNFEVPGTEFLQEPEILNAKCRLPPKHGSTVDLLQLSSHLRRVERQRNSMQVKQENEDLCCFLKT